MTRVYNNPQPQGGARLLVLGAGHYPYAQATKPKVPRLEDISSAAQSAIDFVRQAITNWRDLFMTPLTSVDMLVNDTTNPDGILFECDGILPQRVEAPTMPNILAARSRWFKDAAPEDMLVFYCCGHGIWLPSLSRTFLASDFGLDDDVVWPSAVALDDFALALGDKAPRRQWLLLDCCANTPPPALRAARPAANPLLEPAEGLRQAMLDLHGPLLQAVVASASPGALAYGRPGGRSRFMDVFIEACGGAGFTEPEDDGQWSMSVGSLERAMSTYRVRIAPPEDEDYYTFARLTRTDAEQLPKLMRRADPAACTLHVTSEPAIRLKSCDLNIYQDDVRVGGQAAGPGAQADFRHDVEPWEKYRIEAHWPGDNQTREPRAIPPMTPVKF